MSEHHDRQLDPNDKLALDRPLTSVVTFGGIIGLLALAAAALVGRLAGDWTRLLFAYVTAYSFWLSICLGGLFFVLIQHISRAGATVVVRRVGELVAANVFILAILTLPILLAAWSGKLYLWADPPPDDELIAGKALYLNLPFFTVRWVIYLAVWIGLGFFYLNTSRAQDSSGDPALSVRMQKLAPVGLILLAFTLTFASFDLIKSLSPHWFSTIFGVYYFSGAVVGFYSTQALLIRWMQSRGIGADAIRPAHYHDVGKMMFAFVVFWAYIAYSQFMLIWYANIPEETGWYIAHGATSKPGDVSVWTYVLLFLLFGHFILPFLGMISRDVKRKRNLLAAWAVWLLAMHYLDLLWLVRPSLAEHEHALPIAAAEPVLWLLCLVGVGGLWLAGLAWLASNKPLIPVRDPRLGLSLAFENI